MPLVVQKIISEVIMEESPPVGRVKSTEELERIYRGEYVPGEGNVTRSTTDGRGRMDAIPRNSLSSQISVMII